jgi:hypothetical protein
MPYVPSKKTDGKSTDREILDKAVDVLARKTAEKITNNLSLLREYKQVFCRVARKLHRLLSVGKESPASPESELAQAIYEVGEKYGYEGAFLGELNYSFTRFIQRVPQIMVENGVWKEELRYWLYAATVEALTYAQDETKTLGIGISGVFEDIKDEYKWRVNRSYEAAQIIKSGDCYDTPYYGRLVEVVDEDGNLVGHMEVWLKRSPETVGLDLLKGQIVLKKKE